jgi:hypothetical protein
LATALEGTRLACERTLMAWIRAVTSLIGFGFAICKFFDTRWMAWRGTRSRIRRASSRAGGLKKGWKDSGCPGTYALTLDWHSLPKAGQPDRKSTMNDVMRFLQTTFGPMVLVFTVSNLAAMGLHVRVPEVMVALRNKKSIALILVWSWVLGPAVGYLITKVLPLAEPYAVVVLLASLAPVAPFLQQMVEKARGDMGFAGALVPLVMVGTVVLMPLLAPVLIKGVAVSTSALAKPLLLTIPCR